MSDYAVVMSIGKEVFNPFLEREPGFRRFIGPCLLDVCRSGAEAGSKSFDFHIWCHSVLWYGADELVRKKEETTLRRMKIIHNSSRLQENAPTTEVCQGHGLLHDSRMLPHQSSHA